LGTEHDEALRGRLAQVLQRLGAKRTAHQWVPDLETWTYELEGRTLNLEAETYFGLEVSGDPGLVSKLLAGLGLVPVKPK
ncbi:MAG: hypothetical protein ABR562_02390, partial [Thermoplasmatota archaeon]